MSKGSQADTTDKESIGADYIEEFILWAVWLSNKLSRMDRSLSSLIRRS